MFSRIAFHFHNGTDFFAGVFFIPAIGGAGGLSRI